ncbi:tetratricopeptide repeat protein [Gammaproteobacteria bacterium]|nr:tetratricopeptide repeat protein [Gammaproteobacteria bacterium]
MELTIEQALQQGVAAHKEGKLQEAERLYHAILQAQPAHPDANHNLGVIAVSVNKAGAALPLFKTALEANPKIEQFWLSYIDGLIREKQFENAKQVLEQGKKQGVAGEKFDALEARLKQIAPSKLSEKKKSLTLKEKRKNISESKQQKKKGKSKNPNSASPSESQLNNLIEQFKNGRYEDAEKLAISMTQEFPENQFAWGVLGAVFGQTGRKSEAINAHQRAVQLAPQHAGVHYNLGKTLQKFGRLEEAEASDRKAISLKPDFSEAHYNLGITLQELGRSKDAEASYRKAIALKPDYAEAHSNLGVTLQELGRLEEAEASDRKAIALKPDYAEAHINLGVTLQELGKSKDAEASYRKAIALKPDYAEAHYNLGLLLSGATQYKKAAEQFKLSTFVHSKHYLLRCLYLQDEKSLFFDQLDDFINQGEIHPMIGSLGCRSALRYGIERPNLFCKDPLKYVVKTDLNKQYDFEKIFVKTARTILNENRILDRRQGLLTNGRQTSGNLFDSERDFTEEIQNIIRSEIEKYQVHFKDSEEGFITSWPTDYSLYGWFVSMKSGGKLRPHMHERGWLSGSIYINVPSKSKPESGNFVVCIEEEYLTGENRNQEKNIDVVTGSLCLFPASLLHYTIPFESEEKRIVLAFDVVPA